MKNKVLSSLALSFALTGAGAAYAEAIVGSPAPSLTLKDSLGKTQSLADFKGKYVVLEWNNPECPFVQKHYRSGNMQSLQARYTREGVIWLAVNSTNPVYREYKKPEAMNAWLSAMHAAPTAYLYDEDGAAGIAFGAKTTPHMFVINPQGNVVYAGGIDDKRSTDIEDVKTATNFVVAALNEAQAGKPVTISAAPAYGCSVKYRG